MSFDIFAYWGDDISRRDNIRDVHTRVQYLLTRNKADARREHQNMVSQYKFPTMEEFTPQCPMLQNLPLCSFFLQLQFKLASPYISRDDEGFHICDNPIRKDKVFKVPMISGSGWKGNLRRTARQITGLGSNEEDSEKIIQLFGNSKGEEKHFNRGRLNFFPTFFNDIALEVINPHDRRTKAGTLPITIESVPSGSSGIFSLLYVPFDIIGKTEAEIGRAAAEDLNFVYRSIRKMMLTYGFSAKKGDGFGIAADRLDKITLKMSGVAIEKKKEPKEPKKRILKSFADLKPITPTSESGNFDTLSCKFDELIMAINK